MSNTLSAPRSFKPAVEVLEDRLVLSVSAKVLLAEVTGPIQQSVQRITQLQARLATDIHTIQTDADAFTFFTESQTTQTKVDQDYALIASDAVQIHALVAQIHGEANLATLILTQSRRDESRRVRRVLIPQALGQIKQFVTQADQADTALMTGPGVAQSPIQGQSLAPQYPALNSIPGLFS